MLGFMVPTVTICNLWLNRQPLLAASHCLHNWDNYVYCVGR